MFTKALADMTNEDWAVHNTPGEMGFYLTDWAMTLTPVSPTFIAREWDRTRWNYIHPETGETLRTVFTYF